MPQEESPESLVEAFASQTIEIGSRCGSCAHTRADEINRACAKFAELKESGSTTHTWKDFHRHVLVPTYQYQLSVWTLRRHIKDCLGYE